ncbi:MAG: methyltransferase [Kiloniellales bacterium]|nr:methyltransferase [Kiloniellales bacterium]
MAVAEAGGATSTRSLTPADRLREAVTRLIASRWFQSWAGRFPPTRALARRQAEALFDLCAGFVYSQVLRAFVETGLLDALRTGPKSPRDLAGLAGLPAEPLDRLLRAAVALGLAAPRSQSRYGLGIRGAALAGNPGAVAMIRHHKLLYDDLADPVALLRGEAAPTRTCQYWSYLAAEQPDGLSADAVADYSDLMAVSQVMVAEIVAADFRFRDHRRILDVGGGTGTFLERVAAQAPESALTLFDLPSVAAQAERRLARIGLAERVRAVGGDFFSDPLPAGQDLITLVRVVYDHDDDNALRLLKSCRAALTGNGALLIAEPMSGAASGGQIADAYFGFYLLAMGSGATRSPAEHSALLHKAGFGRVKALPTRMSALVRLVEARP